MKKFLTIVFMLFLSISIFGQSDEVLDLLYEKDNAHTLYTSLLVLQAAGKLDLSATIENAKSYLETEKWGITVLKDEEYITAGSFSLLVIESFDLPHGLIYNFLPIKRYALKELVYKNYILGNPYPGDIMSSFDVIYAVSSLPVNNEINKNYTELDEDVVIESVNMEQDAIVEISDTIEGSVIVNEQVIQSDEKVIVTDELTAEEVIEPAGDILLESTEEQVVE